MERGVAVPRATVEGQSLDECTRAYFAGLIDADGYITIQKSIRRGRSYFTPKVGISGTQRLVHDHAAATWGGRVYAYRPANPAHRIQFQWSRVGADAVRVIEEIEPYLKLKRDQAGIALLLWEHLLFGKGDDPYPWMSPFYDPTSLSDEYKAEIMALNQWRRSVPQAPS